MALSAPIRNTIGWSRGRRASSPAPTGRSPGKVGIVTGGGSGHLPVFTGYVGPGLLDACAVGDVFASPTAEQMAEAMRAANGGAGVLRLYGNYGGDVMNFDMAGGSRRDRGHRGDDGAARATTSPAPARPSATSGAASPAWSSPSRSPAPRPRPASTSTR